MKKHLSCILIAILLLLSGCCSHNWTAATCNTPETCSECGETQGTALGHNWQEATCTSPKTCGVCGTAEGDALGHEAGAWSVAADATLLTPGEQVRCCSRCAAVLEMDAIPVKSPVPTDGRYPFSPKDFLDAYHAAVSSVSMTNNTFSGDGQLLPDGSLLYSGAAKEHISLTVTLDSEGIPVQFTLTAGNHTDVWEMALACALVLDPNADPIEMRMAVLSAGYYAAAGTNQYVFSTTGDGQHCITISPLE